MGVVLLCGDLFRLCSMLVLVYRKTCEVCAQC